MEIFYLDFATTASSVIVNACYRLNMIVTAITQPNNHVVKPQTYTVFVMCTISIQALRDFSD